MAYCSNCGVPLDPTARFCPNCGTPVTVVVNTSSSDQDYKVILVSRGTCTKANAVDILGDLLGYTDYEAQQIINNLPMATAIDLTMPQAQYVAQAMAEFGMEVAIYNGDNYIDLNSTQMNSVFDDNGSFLSNVLAVLTGITIGNRITRYEKWTRPAPAVFRPTYRRTVPMTVYRRYHPTPVRVVPAPRPAPRPAAKPVTVRPAPVNARHLPAQPPRPGAGIIKPQPARPGAGVARPQPARPTQGIGRPSGRSGDPKGRPGR